MVSGGFNGLSFKPILKQRLKRVLRNFDPNLRPQEKVVEYVRALDMVKLDKVKGFVTKMEECMGACDCIITKAGPGTIAEAMIRGLLIILNDDIAGQAGTWEENLNKWATMKSRFVHLDASWIHEFSVWWVELLNLLHVPMGSSLFVN